VSVKRIKIKALRRHSCYVRKASLWRESPYRATLFLDADTLIARSIRPLLDIIADDSNPGFVVTRFADWISTGDIISARIRQWRSVECDGLDVERMVRQSLDYPHPALNTGVMGWRTDSADTLGRWEKLTAAGHKCSFTDELAAQLIVRQEKHTLLSSRFNASPIYYRGDDVIIWHAHGRKHLSRADGRGHEANAIWEPVFREAFANNAGGICDWAPAGDATLANNMKLFA
jgi:hypothetical protein